MTSVTKFFVCFVIFLVIGAAVYILAFRMPNTRRVEQLRRDIVAAEAALQAAIYVEEMIEQTDFDEERYIQEKAQAELALMQAQQDWDNRFAHFMPEAFYEWEMRPRIENIIQPYAENLNITIHDSRLLGALSDNPESPQDGIWLTPVGLTFLTGTEGLTAILYGFANESFDNRILEYNIFRQDNAWNVTMQLDILTRTPHQSHY